MDRRDLSDENIEDILREHLQAELESMPPAANPWEWIQSRLPRQRSRFLGFLDLSVGSALRPALAATALLALVIGVTTWQVSGFRETTLLVTPQDLSSDGQTRFESLESADFESVPLMDSDRAFPTALAIVTSAATTTPQSLSNMPQPTPQPWATPAPQATGWPGSQSRALPTATPRPATLPSHSGSTDTPPDARFRDLVQSGWVYAHEDNLSTFSLDTDRTSFSLALNWAQNGYKIEPNSVRAEEWINAFNYEYPQPAHDDTFGITTDVFAHPLYSDFHMVRLGFQAPYVMDEKPLNVTLVLDASGSMADGNRVDIARAAAEAIRESLSRDDRIAVVHFTDNVISDYTVRHSRADARDVRESIRKLAPHSSTNVQAGLNEGVRLADRARRQRPDAHNYIILMSDGVANVDATDPFAILESAYDRDEGNPLRLITIGVGISNYNDVLLEQLAQYGNGWYRYLNDVDHARATFDRDNWLAISTPFADQTRAQVEWNSDVVESWRMIGYENRLTSDQSFTENRKEFAEIPSGAATTVFFEVRLTGGTLSRRFESANLGTVALRWVDPGSGISNRQATELNSRLDHTLGRSGDALLEFGAVVALAADRYASLPYTDDLDGTAARGELESLQSRTERLASRLGNLNAYHDFLLVLDRMLDAMPQTSERSSGYSN